MSTQSLDGIVKVTVTVSPLSTARNAFDLGLIVGSSPRITTSDRIKIYSSLEDMVVDGFLITDPEYLAVQLYFSQVPRPSRVAIGRWDTTGSETAVQAVTACRVKNTEWYVVTVLDQTKANIQAISAYIESAFPVSVYFYNTEDADVLTNTAGNIMLDLKSKKTHRTIGQYSTTENAVVAIMGYAMGANLSLTNSAYTLAYKSEIGVAPDNLTTTQVGNIAVNNGNIYTSYGGTYNLFTQGVMADGVHFDEVLGLDMLTNDIQLSVMDALSTTTKVPQTEAGVTMLVGAISGPCETSKRKGFIAPGVWKLAPVLSLNTGDMLSNGYLILADTIANQVQSDRDARKSPPIYVPIKLSGAMEHVVIGIQVNR